MDITQPKVSDMVRGDFLNLSERKLMDCLNGLGYDIEIKVMPASEPVGHLKLAGTSVHCVHCLGPPSGGGLHSIARAEFLGLGCERIEYLAASGIDARLVQDDVLVAHPPVRPRLVERHLALLEQLHEEGT